MKEALIILRKHKKYIEFFLQETGKKLNMPGIRKANIERSYMLKKETTDKAFMKKMKKTSPSKRSTEDNKRIKAIFLKNLEICGASSEEQKIFLLNEWLNCLDYYADPAEYKKQSLFDEL